MSYRKFHKQSTGEHQNVPTGFSWTMFFLGAFVPFYRKDWVAGLVLLAFTAVLFVLPQLFLAGFILHVALCMLYNSNYSERLINKGWKVKYD